MNIADKLNNLIPAVIEYLSSIQSLPSSGVLTGAALANTLWLAYNNQPLDKLSVNDIDIFYLTSCVENIDTDDVSEFFKRWSIIEVDKKTNKEYDGSYIRYYVEKHLNVYISIDKSEYDGIINKVYYRANSTSPAVIIKSFDINATMVAFDLETGKLYFNEYYEDFLITQKLKIINFHTPYHSLLRVLEKSEKLNLVYDLNSDLEIFSIFSSHKVLHTRLKFGLKYRNVFVKHAEKLKLHFSLNFTNISTVSQAPLWTLRFLTKKHIQNKRKDNSFYLTEVSDINFYANNIRNNNIYSNIWKYTMFIWVKQTHSFLDGMSTEELCSKRTYEIITVFHHYCCINQSLANAFSQIKLKHIIQIMEWFLEEVPEKKRFVFGVSMQLDFSNINTREEFNYYITFLLVAYRSSIANAYELDKASKS